MPFQNRRLSRPPVALVFLLQVPAALPAHVELPPGFAATEIAPSAGWDTPTGLAFAPDGRIFVIEKRGRVYVIQDGARLAAPFINLEAEVLNQRDFGLLGIALDPGFAGNGLIYLLYVVDPDGDGVDDEQHVFSRLTRYKASAGNPNAADLGTRAVLFGATWAASAPALSGTHGIGALRFGADGTLLVSVGEGAFFVDADAGGGAPGAFGPGKFPPAEDIGAFRSQWLGSLAGKVLRLDPATGAGLASNPYYTGNRFDAASRVWVYGLRNPFRFTLRPGTGAADPALGRPGTLYAGDVGWNDFEEINVAAAGGGDNFGWPCREGRDPAPDYPSLAPAHHGCGTIGTPGNPAPAKGPLIAWHHLNAWQSRPAGYQGRCMGGVAFHAGAHYPEPYRGALFFTDYAAGWIRAARIDANDRLLEVLDFATGVHGPVDLQSDPANGDLIYVSITEGTIARIQYQAGNRPPAARAAGAPLSGKAPLTVAFSSAGTADPDGDPLSCRWTFGDGAGSTATHPTHTYAAPGQYLAALTVSDGRGGESSAAVTVSASGGAAANEPPAVTILEPADHGLFPWRTDIVLRGSATDAEDPPGSLDFTWEVILHHDDHVHPGWANLSGPEVSFFSAEHDDDQDNWFEIVLRVRDPAGGVGSSSVSIHPASRARILDNGQPGTSSTGGWSASGAPFPHGPTSLYSKSAGATYTYAFSGLAPGSYQVAAWWTTYSSRATAVPYQVTHAGGKSTVLVNQKEGGRRWNLLGTFTFGTGGAVSITATGGDLTTAADAVYFLPVGAADPPPVAAIDLVSPNPARLGEPVAFSGHGEDNGTIALHSWRSDLDGFLGAEQSFTTSALSAGRHTVFYRVEDDRGASSEEASVILDVLGDEGVLDNGQPGTSFTGLWSVSGSPRPYGANSLYAKTAGPAYRYQLALPGPGVYDASAWWTQAAGRNPAAPYRVLHATGAQVVTADQRGNGGQWNYLGTYRFGPAAALTITSTGGGFSTSADAVRLVRRADDAILDAGEAGTSATGSWTASTGPNPYGAGSLYAKEAAGTYRYSLPVVRPGSYEVFAWWTTALSRSSQAPYHIKHDGGTATVRRDQTRNGGRWNSLGTFTFKAVAIVTIEALQDGKSYAADAVRLRRAD